MNVSNSQDLGDLVRQRRRQLGWAQGELARRAGVSRPWISELEGGKATAEIGLVFSVLYALNLQLDVTAAAAVAPDVAPLRDVAARAQKRGTGRKRKSVATESSRPAITRDGKSLGSARARSLFTFTGSRPKRGKQDR